jgi:hypothetical protein
MDYLEFVQLYPFANSYLIDLASNRIGKTRLYREREIRSNIGKVNRQIDDGVNNQWTELRDRTNRLFQVSPFENREQVLDYCRKESLFNLVELENERDSYIAELKEVKKSLSVSPTLQDVLQATIQVKEYIEHLLLKGSVEALFKWDGILSNGEKHLIATSHRLISKHSSKGKGFKHWKSPSDYDYGTFWEPVTETLTIGKKGNEKVIGYISENSYGVKCLNAVDTMFVDIDTKGEDVEFGCLPFGKVDWTVSMSLMLIRDFCDQYSELLFAVYRTRNGLRLLEMANNWDARSSESAMVLESLGSDPLFVSLCQKQRTFRARLEVKPWRFYEDEDQTVCKFLGFLGKGKNRTNEALKIKQVHDKWCLKVGELA